MRGIALVFGVVVLLAAAPANASRIVVMTEPDPAGELGSALEIALAGRRVEVAKRPSPAGNLRLDRAAAAQRAAIAAGADAAVWIDLAETVDVCAVSSDGRFFRHAPLSRDGSSRAFAAIATSLLDELLAPPEGPLQIDVNVNVNVGQSTAAVPETEMPSPFGPPPGVVASVPAQYQPARTAIEIGPLLSPVHVGIEAALLLPVSDRWRLGAMGTAGISLDGSVPIFAGLLELRHVGSGRRHLDIGMLGGAATAEGDTIAFVGARFDITWERANGRSTSIGIAPLLIKLVNDWGDSPFPGVFASVRWRLPL